ncbi:hypothetical protein V1277_001908 [Bradyrhizobium sp. AZCC 1588]|uniref:hypothetical protein n=1 Tax=unclassified Bradyrhizobium TaxID=2631580 RepID=UPI002FEEC82F
MPLSTDHAKANEQSKVTIERRHLERIELKSAGGDARPHEARFGSLMNGHQGKDAAG